MQYRGHLENGVIVIDEPVSLPDGAVVEFRPINLPSGQHHPDIDKYAGAISQDLAMDGYFEYLRNKHA